MLDAPHGRPTANGDQAGRLVLFGATDPHHDGRRRRREQMLAMRPVDPTEDVDGRLVSRPSGVHWEYLLADDSSLLVRARDFDDEAEARWDADRLFGSPRPVRAAYVRHPDTGQLSWWLVRGSEPVFVTSRVWLPTQRGATVRSAQRAVAVLKTRPPWGDYSG
ncbi:hypothetical protein ACFXQA_14605 [Microbacterium sp. P07]|uniref:hypothetical protein n=1 Tax=Microbacterium sp. P07 TaxID=3366952 RepID=UPI003745F30F